MPTPADAATMPSRRRFLASVALASGLAGCSGGDAPATETTATETPIETRAAATTSKTTETAETTTEEPRTFEPQKETPESEAIRWRVSFEDTIEYAPVVGEERVFVPVGEPHYGKNEESVGALAGLDAEDGTPQWTTRLPAAPTSQPRFGDGGVYCTVGTSDAIGLHGSDQRCLGFDPDGTEQWRTNPVDRFLTLLALGDGRAFLATRDDQLGLEGEQLFAVGLSDGRTRWSVGSGDAREGSHRDGLVLTAVGGGAGLSVHDASSGERRWLKEVRSAGTDATPFPIADGAVVVRHGFGNPSAFAALELTDGSERWRYVNDDGETVRPAAAVVAGETVVGTTHEGRVVGLDPADGTERWTFAAGGSTGNPVDGDGTVYVSGSDEDSTTLYALDPATGTEQWRVEREAIGPVASTDDALVVSGTDAGREFVAGLSPSDGTERWSFETDWNLGRPVVVDGQVYLYSEDGVVRAIDG